jgi:hypothetical protein
LLHLIVQQIISAKTQSDERKQLIAALSAKLTIALWQRIGAE